MSFSSIIHHRFGPKHKPDSSLKQQFKAQARTQTKTNITAHLDTQTQQWSAPFWDSSYGATTKKPNQTKCTGTSKNIYNNTLILHSAFLNKPILCIQYGRSLIVDTHGCTKTWRKKAGCVEADSEQIRNCHLEPLRPVSIQWIFSLIFPHFVLCNLQHFWI